MGNFDSFSKGFNQGENHASGKAYRRRQPNNWPVEVVGPSVGRIVELQVTEQNDYYAKFYMNYLKTYAECLEYFGVQWEVTDKTIRLTFADGDMAESTRKAWKR